MKTFAFVLFALVSLTFGTASQAQTETPVANPREAVAMMRAAVAARDANAIAALYTSDGIILGSGLRVVAGRDAIRDSWVQSFASGYSMLEVAQPRTERGEDRAAMVFVWRATIQPDGQAAQQVNGRSMLYFKLTEGGWLISADMWQRVP